MLYNSYSHLLGKQYAEITNDCFTLFIDFYKDKFGIEIPEYARPLDFFDPRLNLIPNIAADLNLSKRPLGRIELQDGDILVFKCASNFDNHIGIYVGNNTFIHQMLDSKGCEAPLDDRWFRRLTAIYYSPEVQTMLPRNDNWFNLLMGN